MTNYCEDPWNLLDAALLAALRDHARDQNDQEDQEELHATIGLFRLEFTSEIDPWPLLEYAIMMLAMTHADHIGVDRALQIAQENHDRAVERD
jgi:hypothetical protein